MRYSNIFGKKNTTMQEIRIKCSTATEAESQAIKQMVAAQDKLYAQDMIKKEKDPEKKRLMKELYDRGQYNFDYLFGNEEHAYQMNY